MSDKFKPGHMYELVDKDGFGKYHMIFLPLVMDIMTTGKVIIPLQVDAFGNVSGVEYGNGQVDTSVRIWSAARQFFREVEPLPVLSALKIPVKSASVKLAEPLAA
jgi:hypothetical protein